jgi:quercetin dioxygenase-like cupin family protein
MYIHRATLPQKQNSSRIRLTVKERTLSNLILNDHRDERGFVVNPFEHLANTGSISNCHAFSMEPGSTRGNHSHSSRNEQVLVLAGTIEVEYNNSITTLTAATPSILTIFKEIKHTFRNNSSSTAVVLCWSSERNKQ